MCWLIVMASSFWENRFKNQPKFMCLISTRPTPHRRFLKVFSAVLFQKSQKWNNNTATTSKVSIYRCFRAFLHKFAQMCNMQKSRFLCEILNFCKSLKISKLAQFLCVQKSISSTNFLNTIQLNSSFQRFQNCQFSKNQYYVVILPSRAYRRTFQKVKNLELSELLPIYPPSTKTTTQRCKSVGGRSLNLLNNECITTLWGCVCNFAPKA